MLRVEESVQRGILGFEVPKLMFEEIHDCRKSYGVVLEVREFVSNDRYCSRGKGNSEQSFPLVVGGRVFWSWRSFVTVKSLAIGLKPIEPRFEGFESVIVRVYCVVEPWGVWGSSNRSSGVPFVEAGGRHGRWWGLRSSSPM